MATEVLTITSEENCRDSVRQAAMVLREGGLVALPTETVYGLAASAECEEAVRRLRSVKGRIDAPFTVHVDHPRQAVRFLGGISGVQRRLIERALPGPLTIVFEVPEPHRVSALEGKDPQIIERIYYNGAIGLRCPDQLVTCDVIKEAGCITVASSANRKAADPPINAQQVLAHLDGDVDLLLDAGETKYNGPSTIVKSLPLGVDILRQGVLDERMVRRLSSTTILLVCTGNTCRSPMAEGLLKRMIAGRLDCTIDDLKDRGFRVISAGTAAMDGAPATPEAVEAMAETDIDISGHRSAALSEEMINDAQVILTMTETHRNNIISLCPEAEQKTFLLGGKENINDPIGCSAQVYKTCRKQIEAGLKERLTEIIL